MFFIYMFINICKANPIICRLYLIEILNDNITVSSSPSNIICYLGSSLHRYMAEELFESCGENA